MVAPNLPYLIKGSEVLTGCSWLKHRVTSADQYAEAKMDLRQVVNTGKQKRDPCPLAPPVTYDENSLGSEDVCLTRTKTWLLLAYGGATAILGMAILFYLKDLVFPLFFLALSRYDGNSVRDPKTLFLMGLYTGIMVFTMYLALLGFLIVRYLYKSGINSGEFDKESPETKSHGNENMSMFQFAALAAIVLLVIKELIMFCKIQIAYSNYHLSTPKQIIKSSNLLIKEVVQGHFINEQILHAIIVIIFFGVGCLILYELSKVVKIGCGSHPALACWHMLVQVMPSRN